MIDRLEALYAPVLGSARKPFAIMTVREGRLEDPGHLAVHEGWDGMEAEEAVTFLTRPLYTGSTALAITFLNTIYVDVAKIMARDGVTLDSVALAICHEIGHLLDLPSFAVDGAWTSLARLAWGRLGGLPFGKALAAALFRSSVEFRPPAEGEMDYFAASRCLRKYFADDDNRAAVEGLAVPETLRGKCRRRFPDAGGAALCQRTAMAGMAFVNFSMFANFKLWMGDPRHASRTMPPLGFDTPDSMVVGRTRTRHPLFQCRLDTFLAGALCDKPYGEGYWSAGPREEPGCTREEGRGHGARPLCWFSPADAPW